MAGTMIFESDDHPVELRLPGGPGRLTPCLMTEALRNTPENVLIPLKKILAEGEPDEAATVEDFSEVGQEGVRSILHKLNHG